MPGTQSDCRCQYPPHTEISSAVISVGIPVTLTRRFHRRPVGRNRAGYPQVAGGQQHQARRRRPARTRHGMACKLVGNS